MHWRINLVIIISAFTSRPGLAGFTVQTTDGKVVGLEARQFRADGQEIGLDQQGWFTFKIMGAHKPYKVETKFVSSRKSTRKPWNFYYWPTKADSRSSTLGRRQRASGHRLFHAVAGDDELIRSPGGYHTAWRGYRPGRPQWPARDAATRRRRCHLVSQPL